jgi:proteasome accessory factor B
MPGTSYFCHRADQPGCQKNDRFELPAEFCPHTQTRDAFGIVEESAVPVRVRFSPKVAHAVRDRIWHSTQRVEELDDGGIVLSFEAGGTMEIVSWVLSYGHYAEILDPPEFRSESIVETARYGVTAEAKM